MKLPFTVDQFTAVLQNYNLSVWPMQIVLYAIAAAILLLLAVKSPLASRAISCCLAVLWAWTGIVYHCIFFTAINPAARLFGILCIVQALLFLVFGGIGSAIRFHPATANRSTITGGVLLLYALVLYPLLGMFFGHHYPQTPTFGLPCPTTIFTAGLLFLAFPSTGWFMGIIPVLWAIVGGSAAFKLGIYQDYGLIVSGILLAVLLFKPTTAKNSAPITITAKAYR